MPKIETARCYTPAFPYQRHFDGYVEMLEEDAALFWEVNIDTAPDRESASINPILPDRAAPTDGKAAPEKMIPIGPVPTSEPDASTDAQIQVLLPWMTARTLSLWSQPALSVDGIGQEP